MTIRSGVGGEKEFPASPVMTEKKITQRYPQNEGRGVKWCSHCLKKNSDGGEKKVDPVSPSDIDRTAQTREESYLIRWTKKKRERRCRGGRGRIRGGNSL